MDRDLWRTVMAAIRRAARKVKPSVRSPKYSDDALIVAMFFWSVWHDRCLSWACDRGHYGSLFRPRNRLPSVSQFTRRIKTDSCQRICQRVHDELVAAHVSSPVYSIDGKPLTVGPSSKDRDARRGRMTGGTVRFAKGYKLHAAVSESGRILVWSVMPLNVAEQSVATELLAHVPPAATAATGFPTTPMTLADSNYDSADLYTLSAARCGRQWLTPLKGQQRVKGEQHHPVTLRQMGPARREAVALLWNQRPALAWHVLRYRDDVERTFGTLVCVGGGLGPLPAWVRGLARVRRWVGAKIILYHARLEARERRLKMLAA